MGQNWRPLLLNPVQLRGDLDLVFFVVRKFDIVFVHGARLPMLGETARELDDVLDDLVRQLGQSIGYLIVKHFFLAEAGAQ